MRDRGKKNLTRSDLCVSYNVLFHGDFYALHEGVSERASMRSGAKARRCSEWFLFSLSRLVRGHGPLRRLIAYTQSKLGPHIGEQPASPVKRRPSQSSPYRFSAECARVEERTARFCHTRSVSFTCHPSGVPTRLFVPVTGVGVFPLDVPLFPPLSSFASVLISSSVSSFLPAPLK